MISIYHFLVVAAVLFVLGVFGVVTRRNAVGIMMGVELILNAAGLNFVTFSRFLDKGVDGNIFTIFIIVLAAAEAVVALAIILALFQNLRTIYVDKAKELKG